MLPLDVAPKLSIATYQYWLLLRLTLLLPKKILQAQLLKLLSSRTKSFTLQFSVNQRSLSTQTGCVLFSLIIRSSATLCFGRLLYLLLGLADSRGVVYTPVNRDFDEMRT